MKKMDKNYSVAGFSIAVGAPVGPADFSASVASFFLASSSAFFFLASSIDLTVERTVCR